MAPVDTANVDRGKEDDGKGGDSKLGLLAHWYNLTQELGKDETQCRDGSGGYHRERAPAKEKGHQIAVCATQVDVHASNSGKTAAQLGISECSGKSDHGAQNPDQHNESGLHEVAGDGTGSSEDARTDAAADCDGSQTTKCEGAAEAARSSTCVFGLG